MDNNDVNQTISVEELNQMMAKSPEKLFIIDLMGNEEFAGNHIPGAVNIPVEELGNHISEIPKDKTVVVACRMGLKKSDIALEQLQNFGFAQAKKITSGTTNWLENQKG
jgi:rhodanese-related sulfurtransferase